MSSTIKEVTEKITKKFDMLNDLATDEINEKHFEQLLTSLNYLKKIFKSATNYLGPCLIECLTLIKRFTKDSAELGNKYLPKFTVALIELMENKHEFKWQQAIYQAWWDILSVAQNGGILKAFKQNTELFSNFEKMLINCGDFECQNIIMDVLVGVGYLRRLGPQNCLEALKTIFKNGLVSKELKNVYPCNSRNGEGYRSFLNAFNDALEISSVYSVTVDIVQIGERRLSGNKFYLDFNASSKSIGIYVEIKNFLKTQAKSNNFTHLKVSASNLKEMQIVAIDHENWIFNIKLLNPIQSVNADVNESIKNERSISILIRDGVKADFIKNELISKYKRFAMKELKEAERRKKTEQIAEFNKKWNSLGNIPQETSHFNTANQSGSSMLNTCFANEYSDIEVSNFSFGTRVEDSEDVNASNHGYFPHLKPQESKLMSKSFAPKILVPKPPIYKSDPNASKEYFKDDEDAYETFKAIMDSNRFVPVVKKQGDRQDFNQFDEIKANTGKAFQTKQSVEKAQVEKNFSVESKPKVNPVKPNLKSTESSSRLTITSNITATAKITKIYDTVPDPYGSDAENGEIDEEIMELYLRSKGLPKQKSDPKLLAKFSRMDEMVERSANRFFKNVRPHQASVDVYDMSAEFGGPSTSKKGAAKGRKSTKKEAKAKISVTKSKSNNKYSKESTSQPTKGRPKRQSTKTVAYVDLPDSSDEEQFENRAPQKLNVKENIAPKQQLKSTPMQPIPKMPHIERPVLRDLEYQVFMNEVPRDKTPAKNQQKNSRKKETPKSKSSKRDTSPFLNKQHNTPVRKSNEKPEEDTPIQDFPNSLTVNYDVNSHVPSSIEGGMPSQSTPLVNLNSLPTINETINRFNLLDETKKRALEKNYPLQRLMKSINDNPEPNNMDDVMEIPDNDSRLSSIPSNNEIEPNPEDAMNISMNQNQMEQENSTITNQRANIRDSGVQTTPHIEGSKFEGSHFNGALSRFHELQVTYNEHRDLSIVRKRRREDDDDSACKKLRILLQDCVRTPTARDKNLCNIKQTVCEVGREFTESIESKVIRKVQSYQQSSLARNRVKNCNETEIQRLRHENQKIDEEDETEFKQLMGSIENVVDIIQKTENEMDQNEGH